MRSYDRMLKLNLAQFTDKRVMNALLQTIGEEYDYHDGLKRQVREKIWPDVAVGEQLDMCGEVAGIERTAAGSVVINFFGFPNHGGNTFGTFRFYRYGEEYAESSTLGDTEYRVAVKNKILKNNTRCTRYETINSIKTAIKRNVKIENAGNANIRVTVYGKMTTDEKGLLESLDLVIRGVGIGIEYVYVE